MGELAVVRQQEGAGRVGVEAADGDDSGGMVDEIDDGRASMRIARGRDDAGRLVQQDVRKRLGGDAASRPPPRRRPSAPAC